MANKKTISCQIEPEIKDEFQRLYPYILSRFLKKCMILAIKDRNFFNDVFFREV